MRVGIVSTSYPRHEGDFAGSFVADFAASLTRAGHEVRVWAPHAPGLVERETDRGILVTRFRYAPESLERVAYGDGIANNIRRNPLAVLGLPGFSRALKRAGLEAAAASDVVHVNWAQTAALVAEPGMSAPVVVTVHGSDVRLARNSRRWLASLRKGVACPPISAVIAVSAELARDLRELVPGIEPVVVPTGVDAALLDHERSPSSAGSARLVFVGRLLASKGVHDLVEAFVALDPKTTLRIVGAGPERDSLTCKVEQAGVSDRVTFVGAVAHDRAIAELAAADIAVVPSHAEGCGLVALEASALGVPTVATRVGVHVDLLRHDDLLFDPGDAGALAERLRKLVDDSDAAARFGAGARARVASAYTWDALAEQVVAVYERAVGRGDAR